MCNLLIRSQCLLLLLLLPVFLNAQQLNLRNYSSDILPSTNIYKAFQDKRGFMWFASDRGVIRYDCYNFTTFTKLDGLGDNEVFDFFEDTKGRIWFHTANGKACYYKDGAMWNSSVDTTLRPLDATTSISSICEDQKGNVWFTTEMEILKLRPDGRVKRFCCRPEIERVHKMIQVDSSTFVVSSITAVYTMKFDKPLENIISVSSNIKLQNYHRFMKFEMIGKRHLIYKDDHHVYVLDLSTNSIVNQIESSPGTKILNLSCDGSTVWLGTSDGALKVTDTGSRIEGAVLKKHAVTSVLRDREGNYWFTTYGHGVYFCTSMDMYGYTTENGLKTDWVNCLSKDTLNNLWIGYGIGSSGTISNRRNGHIAHVSLVNDLSMMNLETSSINFSSKGMLVATTVGGFVYNGGKPRVYYGYTRSLAEFPKGMFRVAGPNYIAMFDARTFDKFLHEPSYKEYTRTNTTLYLQERRRYSSDFLYGARVKKFLPTSDNMGWVASDAKLHRLLPKHPWIVKLDNIGLTGTVNDLAEMNDKTIVLATNADGVVLMKDMKAVMTLTLEDGLASNICNAVAVDDETIWVATSNGLNKITGYPKNIKIDHFNVYDGLLANDLADVQVVNDTVWIATKNGISCFRKDLVTRKEIAPLMYIQRITISGEPVNMNAPKGIVFDHNQNDVGISYTGLLYSNGEPLLYRYKLHHDDPWRYTRSTSVYLPELGPDEYEFHVAAQGRFGEWSKVASVSFEIRKPIWKSAWFIVALIVLLLGSVGLITRNYIQRKKREIEQQHRVTLSELRSLRAQMNPHFLFNALNSIQAVLLTNNVETTHDYLGRFGRLMRLILDHSDKPTVSIREELESTTNYLELEQLRASHTFQYKIDIDPDLDIENTEIPAMILQPFIENAIWHGFGYRKDATDLLLITIKQQKQDVTIDITDNGIGRRKAMNLRKKNHKSKGIQLVRERIEILNFNNERKIELKIVDLEDDQGTSVVVKIPTV